ncbi:hypothetical protein [Promicromonospora sp. NPDC023805]|uniref:hypothetical protein n=1 Tax=Promicromonospora sp. NPDC023805 TaxID=3154696 RepID=UPI0033EF5113
MDKFFQVLHANGTETLDFQTEVNEYGPPDSEVLVVLGDVEHRFLAVEGRRVEYSVADSGALRVLFDGEVQRVYGPSGWVFVEGEQEPARRGRLLA